MLTEKSTVGSWVATNPSNAKVMDVYGIDFCCGGNISLDEAAKAKNVNISELLSLLNSGKPQASKDNPNEMLLDALVDFIVEEFHMEMRRNIPTIITYLDKVVAAHGVNHFELIEIEQLVKEGMNDLLFHIQKEEAILFPLIKKAAIDPSENFVLQPISVMEREHESEGNRMKRISSLTNQYQAPSDACNTYKALYSMLAEFESRLHLHIHIENNILFPKVKNLFNS